MTKATQEIINGLEILDSIPKYRGRVQTRVFAQGTELIIYMPEFDDVEGNYYNMRVVCNDPGIFTVSSMGTYEHECSADAVVDAVQDALRGF